MKNWSLLLPPFGILISGLAVLYLKAHPQPGVVHTQDLLGIAYLPWLAAVIVAAVILQGVLVRRHMDTSSWKYRAKQLLNWVNQKEEDPQ